jgi:hypothetical protein
VAVFDFLDFVLFVYGEFLVFLFAGSSPVDGEDVGLGGFVVDGGEVGVGLVGIHYFWEVLALLAGGRDRFQVVQAHYVPRYLCGALWTGEVVLVAVGGRFAFG